MASVEIIFHLSRKRASRKRERQEQKRKIERKEGERKGGRGRWMCGGGGQRNKNSSRVRILDGISLYRTRVSKHIVRGANFYLSVFNLLERSGNTYRGSSAVARLPLKRKILRSARAYIRRPVGFAKHVFLYVELTSGRLLTLTAEEGEERNHLIIGFSQSKR